MAPQLFAVKGPLHGRRFLIEQQPITLGRGSTSSIVVDDKLASRRHAEIHRESRGYVLYDLSSSNGTKVNGQQIQSHVLENGDVIVVGEQTFVFQEDGPPQQQHEQPQTPIPPQHLASPFQQQYAPPQQEPASPLVSTSAGEVVPSSPAPAQPVLAPPAPIAQPQVAAATQSTVSRVGAFVALLGGLLLTTAFFMPYIVLTLPLSSLPVNLPLGRLNDMMLALNGLQIIQATLDVNSLLAGMLAGLPDFAQDAIKPLIEPLLSDIQAHLVWFLLPAIGSFLVGIWYILVGGTAAMGLFTGRRVLLTLVRIVSLASGMLVVVALGSAYMQRTSILDVSNVFVRLSSGFWMMLAGILIAMVGMLFIRAGSRSAVS